MSAPPIICRWTGEAFSPLGRSAKEANASRVIGEIYRLTDHEERSEASHRFYFAAIAEGWSNLPEHLAAQFQDPEALRKAALIRTGYATQQQVVCASHAEAQRLVLACGMLDKYALCDVSRNVVTIWRAESQSYRSQGKKRFHQSKDDVLSYIANLIGVLPSQLQQERAA